MFHSLSFSLFLSLSLVLSLSLYIYMYVYPPIMAFVAWLAACDKNSVYVSRQSVAARRMCLHLVFWANINSQRQ